MSFRNGNEEHTFVFRLPPQSQLPLYTAYGRPVRDSDISHRVEKALLEDYQTNSSWRPKTEPVKESGSVLKWFISWRAYLMTVMTHLGSFSLGIALSRFVE